MKISIVIIAYNLEKFIGEAINSVLNQTVKADEVFVVDDCSTDSTAAIIHSFKDRVTYVKMPFNSGALLTALTGVKQTSGDIICMLDGDDMWAENKIEVAKNEFLKNSKLLLLSHNHKRVDAAGNQLNITDETHNNINKLLQKNLSSRDFSELLKDSILAQKGYWLGSAYTFRKSAFNIKHFEEQISTVPKGVLKGAYLDLVIAPYLVLLNKNMDVGYTNETYFNYRIHAGGSLSKNYSVEKAIESAKKGKAINELILYILRENHASEKYIQRRNLILSEYDYLCNLYNREYIYSFKSFLQLAKRLWSYRKTRKELLRLLSVVILGPRYFLKLKYTKTFN
jgi:glycosyltransferase involved in cell wall biosynthesis